MNITKKVASTSGTIVRYFTDNGMVLTGYGDAADQEEFEGKILKTNIFPTPSAPSDALIAQMVHEGRVHHSDLLAYAEKGGIHMQQQSGNKNPLVLIDESGNPYPQHGNGLGFSSDILLDNDVIWRSIMD